jgi:hypothetical protein
MSAVLKLEERAPKTAAEFAREFTPILQAAVENEAKHPALIRYFRANPDFFDKVSPIGAAVQIGLLEKIAKDRPNYTCLVEETRARKRELMRGSGTAAEDLLAQNAVLCWLRLQIAELERTQAINSNCSIKYMEYIDKALTRAQNRFTRALESLARVRALFNR